MAKQLYTNITLPGAEHAAGIGDCEEQTAAEMIRQFRQYAERQKAEAEEVLAADDNDFRIVVERGVWRTDHIKTLQEGRGA